jgi:hypothetical protein
VKQLDVAWLKVSNGLKVDLSHLHPKLNEN